MSTRQKTSTAVATLMLSIAASSAIASTSFSALTVIIWTIGLIWILYPLTVSTLQRQFDILEPIWIVAVAMVTMFFLRPLRLLADGIFVHRGYNFRDTMEDAALLALVSSIALGLGYISPPSMRLGHSIRPFMAEWYSSTITVSAVVLIVMGSSLFLLFVLQSGGLSALFWLASGRETGQDALFRGSSGYLYQGPLLLVPAGLLLFADGCVHGKRRSKVFGLIATLPVMLLYSGGGDRLFLMVSYGSFLVFWLLWTGKRPALLPMVIGGYFILTVGIGYLGQSRVIEERRGSRWNMLVSALVHPERAVNRLTTGGDADMFDTLANVLSVVPGKLPFQHGSVFYDPLIRMIPRQLWPSGIKPMEANDRFVALMWPQQYAVSRAGPASSFIGQLYQDSGWLSVIAGMVILGVALGALWKWRLIWHENASVQLVYACLLPYVIVLLRGNLTHVLSTGAFTFVPLILTLTIAGQRRNIHAWGIRQEPDEVSKVSDDGCRREQQRIREGNYADVTSS